MSKNSWNKKALAALTIAAFVGVMSPISASAWEEGEPDQIVTATVDLGTGNGGGGGGGGTDTCTGYTTLDLPTNSLSLNYQTTRAKDPGVDSWTDNPDTDLNNDSNNTDTIDLAFDWEDLNTQRDYVSQELDIAFDANNCIGSQDWAELDFERMPVEQANQFGGWSVAEMAWGHYKLNAGVNRASADLVLDRGLVNGNVNTVRVFDHIWNSNDISGGDVNSSSYNDWGTIWDELNPLQEPQGTSGVATVRAILTLFGDEAKGKYRVKYGVDLWINN
jgi:hypothetical protein